MEIEHAKLILSNFRPNGQDAEDLEFVEALALATRNLELGEWLVAERARDSVFADALNSIPIPKSLKDEIIAALNENVSLTDDPDLDRAFIAAFADIHPPQGLREQIFVVLEQEKQEKKVIRRFFPIGNVISYAAVAVVVILAVFLMFPLDKTDRSAAIVKANETEDLTAAKILSYEIQQDVGQKLVNQNVHIVSNSFQGSMDWLRDHNLPVVKVPSALQSMQCVGVTKVELGEGVEASLVRFLSADKKEVNMLVIAKKNVQDIEKLPGCKVSSAKDVYFCPACKYWIARMQEEDCLVILLSKLEKDLTAGLF
jgi:hypothetical protein